MSNPRRESGLTLVETLIAITIFSIMTVGLVPVIGTAMSGGASTRTESVGRNVTSKTLERLRGLQYHVAYSSSPNEVDVLDLYFPSRTPAFVASVGTGYDSATQSYVTTCDSLSTADACKTLPGRTEIPSGYVVEVRATFKTPANPAVTQPVPTGYAWNAAGGLDAPPSELLEVKVTTAWSVGTKARTFALQSYLGAHARAALASGGGGAATPTPPGASPAAPPPPTTVKLRGEARIDYGYEMTTTYQDNNVPPRIQEYTGTLGTAVAYGEQLDSGSKAELNVRAGQMRLSRPADPAVSGDAGVDATFTGASIDAVAPPDAGTITTTTAAQQNAVHTETPSTGGAGFLAASEAGTMSGTRGASPTVSGGLPFVKGYYDLNGATAVSPASFHTHMWLMPQVSGSATFGTETTTNPLYHWASSFTKKTITVSDSGTGGVDPRGEVSVDSTPTTPAGSRAVTATATIPAHGTTLIFPTPVTPSNAAILEINQFTANVACTAKADASAASTATGSWSATLEYYSYEGTGKNAAYELHRTTLPTQTLANEPIPVGNTNPLQTIKAMNGGNGPKIYSASTAAYDVYLFTGNGRRGLLTGWSQGTVQTSISSDDRVASASLNGAIRMESSPLWGPWPNASTGQVSQKPLSDFTFNMGKLSCKAEDYR